MYNASYVRLGCGVVFVFTVERVFLVYIPVITRMLSYSGRNWENSWEPSGNIQGSS